MPASTPFTVRILSRNQRDLPSTLGTLDQLNFDRQDRLKNAARTTLMWIAIAFGSALVPFWHYFLVPGFFMTAWVLGLEKMSEKSRNGGGTGECPQCKHSFRIEKSKWNDRMTDTCEKCFCELELIPQIANQ
jgi:hypothetical protein